MTLLLLVSGSVLRGKITALSVTATPGRRYLKFAAKTVAVVACPTFYIGLHDGKLYTRIGKVVIEI